MMCYTLFCYVYPGAHANFLRAFVGLCGSAHVTDFACACMYFTRGHFRGVWSFSGIVC